MRATKVNAGLAESNGRLLLGIWRDSLHVTCGLTACTQGSAPGPTLGNEYGKTLPLPLPSAESDVIRYVITIIGHLYLLLVPILFRCPQHCVNCINALSFHIRRGPDIPQSGSLLGDDAGISCTLVYQRSFLAALYTLTVHSL